jgi:hypothetical protein
VKNKEKPGFRWGGYECNLKLDDSFTHDDEKALCMCVCNNTRFPDPCLEMTVLYVDSTSPSAENV